MALPNRAGAQMPQPVAAAELNSILINAGVPTAGSITADVTMLSISITTVHFVKHWLRTFAPFLRPTAESP